MNRQHAQAKLKEWLRRYIPAEVLGTALALAAAWFTFAHTHSYAAAAGAGWAGEGIGFYGYFVVAELTQAGARLHYGTALLKRAGPALAHAGTNMLVEFAPAEIVDSFVVRPFLMFLLPHYIHPYAVGFLVGKFGADIVFYAMAISGYELRKRWLKR
ncbi:MAG TPA: hypothetical protein VF261_00905 [Candidatus Saccharimonadales bacterium]